MKAMHVIALGSLVAAGTMVIGGCNDPRFAERSEPRIARINRYSGEFVERENDGVRRLEATGRLIERQARWHEELLQRDLKRVSVWTERDFQRWQQRQPDYQAYIQDQLDGDLESADYAFPRMFY